VACSVTQRGEWFLRSCHAVGFASYIRLVSLLFSPRLCGSAVDQAIAGNLSSSQPVNKTTKMFISLEI
jgi:hypothetical protein